MTHTSATQQSVIDTLAQKLRPLVAELQDAGVGVGEWIEAVKISSFQAARAATDAESGRAIYTRMSVRTGMTRTEIARLRRLCSGQESAATRMTGRQRTLRVLEAWHSDPDYLDDVGNPRALAARGPAPSLASLTKRYAGDVPASSVMAELRRQGLLVPAAGNHWQPRADYRDRALAGARRLHAGEDFLAG